MVIGHWSLVIGHWSLVIGHWSLGNKKFSLSPPLLLRSWSSFLPFIRLA
ncbi:MAG: hypothetical protein GVY04_09410 [Cyanobacteria bacterium]|nr:hypothetical protein [Cyanobacteria bacterium GSL.Bin1]